jgi:hypothetical protein
LAQNCYTNLLRLLVFPNHGSIGVARQVQVRDWHAVVQDDSLTEARNLRDQKLAEWRARFDRARQDAPLSLAEIETEAREAYYRMLEALELFGERKGAKAFIEEIGMTEEESNIFAAKDAIEEALEEHDWQKAERAIKGIERRKGITLDREGKTYSLLARAVR